MTEPSEHATGSMYIPDPAGWRWMRFVMDHNPCFLLSALSMFVGVFLLNAARDVNAAELGKLLGVLCAVNVYEFALIGLALLLIKKLGMMARNRDAVLLLLIQLLFLTDGGFLVNESVQTNPQWGWIVNVILFVLAIAKAALAMSGLKIVRHLRTLGFLAVQLAMLCGLPMVLSKVAVGGEVSAGAMYAAWWAVGLLPLLYDIVAGRRAMEGLTGRQQFLRRSYVIIPWLMLIAHLGFFHYVYEAPFYLADLSPVFLGLAVATRRVRPTFLLPAKHLAVIRWGLPALAVLLSLAAPADMAVAHFAQHGFSTVRLTIEAAMIVCGYFVSWNAAGSATAAVTLMEIGRAIWPVTKIALRQGADNGDRAVRSVIHLLPTTTAGWGVLAVISAFVLLAIGAMASLRRKAET